MVAGSRSAGWCAVTLLAVACVPTRAEESAFADAVVPFLRQHCVACHGADQQEGEVRFDGPLPDLVDGRQAEQWLTARQLIAQGQMPPAGRPRPSADELTTVLEWIDDAAARAATITRGGIGRRALRRLTPQEFASTAMDLLGLSFPHFKGDLSARLIHDTGSEVFSNDSNLQSMQPLLLRRSLDLAEQLVDVALPEAGEVVPMTFAVDLREYAAGVQAGLQNNAKKPAYHVDVPAAGDGDKPATLALRGRWAGPNGGRRPPAATRLDAERGVVLEPNAALIGTPAECLILQLPGVPDRGVLRVRAQAGGRVPPGDACPVLRLGITRQDVALPIAEIVVTAPAAKPAEYTLEVPLALVAADWKGIHRDGHLSLQIDNAAALLLPTPSDPGDRRKEHERPARPRTELVLASLLVEVVEAAARGPHLLPAAPNEREAVQGALAAFLGRAFRRPASADDVAAFMGLYDAERARGGSFLPAYKAAVTAALAAPQMLFLIEPKDVRQQPLTAWEIASRLSYLAWGTAPDDELRDRAADGSLVREDELRRQLDRLLDDPRSYGFCRDFAGQWLRLDTVLHIHPPAFAARADHPPEDVALYESALRRDLTEEPARFLQEVLRRNGPVTAFVDADFMVVNGRLAMFYGIEGVAGDQFRAVPAVPGRGGGLLTQAGCIAAASHGRERAEILRGVYLIERILGIDIPPPPGNVQPLDVQLNTDKKLRQLTPRLHVEAHSSVATCAVCHQRIDPLGFAWDQYDMFGRMRRQQDGSLVAAMTGGRLPDKTPFADFEEFRGRLIAAGSTAPLFVDAFTRRLFAYALGRGLDHGDEPHLRALAAATGQAGGGLRDLLAAMVLSTPFRNK